VALKVTAPLAGVVVPLADVPDPVFAGALVGPGVAIDPDAASTEAVAPIAGELVKVKPHAFVVLDDTGKGVLVHLGIDTVKLAGDGFELIAAEGQRVAAGDPVVRWSPVAVREHGFAPICPIIALDASEVADAATGRVATGEAIFTWV
jgi:PTS system glucose-specific IIA component